MGNENPIEASKKWLVECGYTETEAENLLRAIYHEDPENLWELAPKWIEHVGEHKKYQHAILDLVAQGLFSVTAKKWLVECGYTETEAENLLRAIYHEDPENLWELAPKWIEHVGEHKKYQHAILDLVAQGLFSVTANETGEWLFSLNDRGIEAGRQIGLKP